MTILPALKEITINKKYGLSKTLDAVTQFLDYVATNTSDKINFEASDMILHIHSDSSYLCAPEAKSRAGDYLFLGGHPIKYGLPNSNSVVQTHFNCVLRFT